MARIALIVPSYGHFDYVRKTVESFLQHSPTDSICYVIDDCSDDWQNVDWSTWQPHVLVPDTDNPLLALRDFKNILCYRFPTHSGLTRSWNLGLQLGQRSQNWQADIIVCGNSDILFTPMWYLPLVAALEQVDLVGPTTNAPGRVFDQSIDRFARNYRLTDDPNYLADVAKKLATRYQYTIYSVPRVNGFFMMATTEKWWSGAFDKDHVINPAEKMDNGAYEVQTRWRQMGRKIGLVPACFIWHYRSVSRGRKGTIGVYGKGAWRPKKGK